MGVKAIGEYMGGYDHTTLINGLTNVKNWEFDDQMKSHYLALREIMPPTDNESGLEREYLRLKKQVAALKAQNNRLRKLAQMQAA